MGYIAPLWPALSLDLGKRDSFLNVKPEIVGNTAVKASITNNGETDLNLFETGYFLDEAAVEKVDVFQASALPLTYSPPYPPLYHVHHHLLRKVKGISHSSLWKKKSKVAFKGIHLHALATDLAEDVFETIGAGATLETTFAVVQTYDVSDGSAVDLSSEGVFAYAEPNTTQIAGVVPCSSNLLSAEVDGAATGEARSAFLGRRSMVQNAATSTSSGNAAKVTEYYKSSTSSVRSTAASVFSRVATECGSASSGVARYYCSDVYGVCSSTVLALFANAIYVWLLGALLVAIWPSELSEA
ncbi:hypothetical protein DL764_002687 [Monosporascus ibericus]|uniref:Neutral protease 2 n=1 Tax=Monosporascus ibericus TaxID=155417 RepID=A0A4Q4TNI9_9PEZI|nr:hypothetical protein DL764_002687 [Monosporascus ibericus]